MLAKKSLVFTLVVALLAAVVPVPAQAQSGGGLSVPVSGKADHGGKVSGTFTIRRFVNIGTDTKPAVGALGTLVLQTPAGLAVTQVTMPVALATGGGEAAAITAQQATCEVLELTLGPLDLNLLGLQIHLDTVHLNVDANPFGGLLGQLLCGIANLLNLGDIPDVLGALNQLVSFLEGLLG